MSNVALWQYKIRPFSGLAAGWPPIGTQAMTFTDYGKKELKRAQALQQVVERRLSFKSAAEFGLKRAAICKNQYVRMP